MGTTTFTGCLVQETDAAITYRDTFNPLQRLVRLGSTDSAHVIPCTLRTGLTFLHLCTTDRTERNLLNAVITQRIHLVSVRLKHQLVTPLACSQLCFCAFTAKECRAGVMLTTQQTRCFYAPMHINVPCLVRRRREEEHTNGVEIPSCRLVVEGKINVFVVPINV